MRVWGIHSDERYQQSCTQAARHFSHRGSPHNVYGKGISSTNNPDTLCQQETFTKESNMRALTQNIIQRTRLNTSTCNNLFHCLEFPRMVSSSMAPTRMYQTSEEILQRQASLALRILYLKELCQICLRIATFQINSLLDLRASGRSSQSQGGNCKNPWYDLVREKLTFKKSWHPKVP